jgi:hypothetical protein
VTQTPLKETPVTNRSKSCFGLRPSMWRRTTSFAAIVLMQLNLALAASPAAAQSPALSQQAPAASPSAQAVPDSPTPAASATPAPASLAQDMQQQSTFAPQKPFNVPMPHSHNPIFPYRPSTAPELNLFNSPRLQNLIRAGKIYVSLHDAIAVAIENNLDLAYFRYNFPIAQTDIQRTRSGAQANGVNAVVTQSTQGGFSGSSGGGGGSSGGSAAAGAGGIVTSTLGAGTLVSSFDPFVTFRGFVDHTTTPEVNAFQIGTPLFKTNQIEVLANYSQSFPIGTNVSVNYQGERLATNSPDFSINPELFSNFQVQIAQPLLAGFGLATNERFIRIAKRNAQITDLVFKQQVIATVTQVANIYWDLVNAYDAEQINERSLGFANKTLSDDQKQLELKAIPAMQVMTDQSVVAAAEGNLTVARASLRLNELLMKNILTKVDDPAIDEMAVIPLDLQGESNPNADKSIDDLIAEAEKKRPEVSIFQMQAAVQKQALKDINSELLPTLNAYGFYAGQGVAGPKNPNCNQGPQYCSTDLPTGFPDMFINTFNYSAPEYQVGMTLSINLRNRQQKCCKTARARFPRCNRRRIFSSMSATRSLPWNRRRPVCRLRKKRRTLRSERSKSPSRSRISAPSPAPIRCLPKMHWPWPRPLSTPRRRPTKKRRWISTAPSERRWSAQESRSTTRERASSLMHRKINERLHVRFIAIRFL